MIRVWKSIKWQLQAVFHEIWTAAAFFIILNGLLLILPLSACRVIDKKAGLLVLLISICYAASLLLGLFYGMNHMLEKPDVRQNELWRLAEPNPWLRIFSRLTAVAAVMAFSFFNGQAGTILMQKFADANHSYFRMQMKDDIPGAFPAIRAAASAPLSLFDTVFQQEAERPRKSPYADRRTVHRPDGKRCVKEPPRHSRCPGRNCASFLPALAVR